MPVHALAQSQEEVFAASKEGSNVAMVAVVFIIISAILTRIWMGIMNHSEVHNEPIDKVESRSKIPYLPSIHTIVVTIACTAGLFFLSLKTMGGIPPFHGDDGASKAAIFFVIMGVLSITAQFIWPRAKHYVFAIAIGTLVTFILVGFYGMLFTAGVRQDPFSMALGIVCTVLAWKFLFGPWRPQVKATILGTFIFWLGMNLILRQPPDARTAHLLAIFIAFIPAVIWCLLFLKEHKQRLSMVILMFFAGMLSTAPVLFYDAMVRNRVELSFFLFKITPENFTRSSNAFVTGNLVSNSSIKSTLIATLISFLLVGLIEEFSKFWVLRKSGRPFFHSIDDVLQLGIIVAIGFAFAENVMNPSYFLAFVRQYLIIPEVPMWGAFMGNVLGRAILTNMVHILSTGVLAYFYALKLFAGPVLEEEHKKGKIHPIPLLFHTILRFPEKLVYKNEMMIIGMLSAITLHGLFNLLVTLPDLLPGHPRTLGDLMGSDPGSPLHYVALLIIPSLFYVVGGFWILSELFYKKENMKERGMLVQIDTFVEPKQFFGRYAK
jgi:hypothetical protein